ncbi:DEAD/DEAH box helicase [Kordiimonas sediminis]|uniref:DEAD/DEAH box helicase n=1 Tax=Kordiimonas sediminis TaxID=1735581 RepID=A0A919AP20_9PROT|nr:DEAD/DEAH box helicase [Kordiimonas sediminis]GHF17910.1 DEAD/DEAH box helicase [Kordiimonas sediminis]
MTSFNTLGLAEPILKAILEAGYTTPTPIQTKVIPACKADQDVIGIAQTGTGKTASFVLPILNKIATAPMRPQSKCCRALIITPTRELAAQIADNIHTYSKFMQVRTAVVVGGTKPGPQIKACARGLDILVATPGRLLDHMSTNAIDLSATQIVIADEADQMMDMGFLPSVRRIMKALPSKRQTVLMSATMPDQIRSLAKDFMQKPTEISVAPASRPIERIEQSIRRVEKAEKRAVLCDILSAKDIERAVVFTRTKHGANKVAKHLEGVGLSALAIHGNKSQSQREKALASFKAGTTKILVATDIAARGIDIDGVSHVINFELPNVPESYVHRIGRTARAGRSGIAISLCASDEIKLLRDIEKLIGKNLDPSSDERRNPSKTSEENRQKTPKQMKSANRSKARSKSKDNSQKRSQASDPSGDQGENISVSGKKAHRKPHSNGAKRGHPKKTRSETDRRKPAQADNTTSGLMRILSNANTQRTQTTSP